MKQSIALFGSRQRALRAKGAFTLVELLVVIGTITVLLSLLMPALWSAKRKVQRTECLSRMKQWGLGFHLYADENGGWIPREGYHGNGEVYWNSWEHLKSTRSQDVWYNALAPTMKVPPASSYVLPKDRTRFYSRESFFHCPAAPFPRAIKSLGYQISIFSVGMNSQLVLPPNIPCVRLARVRDPSRTVLMLDNLLEDEKPVVEEQAQDNLGQPAAYANRFAGRRHGVGGNLAFVDGHAAFLRGEEVVETKGINAGFPIMPPVNIFWEVE